MTGQQWLCICGSMTFIDQIESLASELRSNGYLVETPQREEDQTDWSLLSESAAISRKRGYIDEHLEKIKRSDLVLIANYRKNGIDGYVGPNTLMEAAFAHALGIPVVCLNELGDQACRLELASIAASTETQSTESIRRLLANPRLG